MDLQRLQHDTVAEREGNDDMVVWFVRHRVNGDHHGRWMLKCLFVALNHPFDHPEIVPLHLADRVRKEEVAWKLFDSLVLTSDDDERSKKLRRMLKRRPWLVPILRYHDLFSAPPPLRSRRGLISQVYL